MFDNYLKILAIRMSCRRQVFWISKHLLQLVMEYEVYDWLLRQIHSLRDGEIIAHGIRWIHNVRRDIFDPSTLAICLYHSYPTCS